MPEAARAPRARGARDLDILIVVVCKVYVVFVGEVEAVERCCF